MRKPVAWMGCPQSLQIALRIVSPVKYFLEVGKIKIGIFSWRTSQRQSSYWTISEYSFFLSPFTLIPTERQEAFTLKAFKSSNNSSFHTSFQNLKPLVRQWKYFWITNHNFVIKQLGASTLKRKIELNSCSWWVYLDKIISDFALFIEIVLRKWKDLRVKEF